jgi:hypothetical protein
LSLRIKALSGALPITKIAANRRKNIAIKFVQKVNRVPNILSIRNYLKATKDGIGASEYTTVMQVDLLIYRANNIVSNGDRSPIVLNPNMNEDPGNHIFLLNV